MNSENEELVLINFKAQFRNLGIRFPEVTIAISGSYHIIIPEVTIEI